MDPEPRRRGPRTPFVAALEVRCAVALLSRLRIAPAVVDRTGSAAFGLVGAVLGALAGAVALALGDERRLLAAALALGILALASGALHLDGLADTADALAAPDPANAERARRDPAIGAAGAAAVALVLLVDTAALASLPAGTLLPALAVAGSVSRAVPALAAPWAPRAEGGFGAWFAAHSGRGGSVVALGTSMAVAVLAGDLVAAAGWLAGVIAGLGFLGMLARRFGTVTGDGYGAAIEVAFAASLVGGAVVR